MPTDQTAGSVIYSESSALREILEWSQSRPNWQRDALRRRIVNGEFTESDDEQLLAICLDEAADFEPLKEQHIAPEKTEGKPVSILSVSEPKGINALAQDQCVRFGVKGLTVVYGDNGSGKSGYVRVLKDACRSRDERFEILNDINAGTPQNQEASIHYAIGDQNQVLGWSPGSLTPSALASISIFDSGSARSHLGGEHNVAYTPFPMQVMRDLAELCDRLKLRIDASVGQLKEKTPAVITRPTLSKDSAAGGFLWSLDANSKKATLNALISETEGDVKRHQQLREALAGEPLKVSARLSAQKSRLSECVSKIELFWNSVSEGSFQSLTELRRNHDAKSKLAKAASEELFSNSPLPDIGGELWKTLWEAARQYSDNVAYPEMSFPKSNAGDLCVLCQQPVGDEVMTRQQTFENFVKGTTKAEEDVAKKALADAITIIEQSSMDDNSIQSLTMLLSEELGEAELSAECLEVMSACQSRQLELFRDSVAKSELPPNPKPKLDKLLSGLEIRIRELTDAAKDDARKRLQAELQSFDDKLALAVLKDDVEAEIDRLKKIEAYEKMARTTAKRPVTTKNQELSNNLVTDALRGRFAREIEKLKISPMPMELRKERDRNAESFFRVRLVGKPSVPVEKILSEGEHRCVALAAFLAELVTANDYSGIVFDDPMSSLDHLYRGNVAQRLVEESVHRQVIVFTHDLTFLFELTGKAEEMGQSVTYQTVSRRSVGPGFVEQDLPFKAQSAGEMENSLRSLLKSYKGNFEHRPQAEREMIVKGILTQLRIAWEQGIAEFIKPVLNRFDRSIKPNSLFKLLVLKDSDVAAVSSARTRLSEDVHAAPETLNPSEATHEALVNELDIFRNWLSDLKDRQKNAKN